MAKVYVLMANGLEEIEALTTVDVLRRGNVATEMVSIEAGLEIEGAHGIRFMTDRLFSLDELMDGDMLVLPGGGGGTNALMAHEGVRELLKAYEGGDKYLAAICAAPSVLGRNGILQGKKATCYPGFEEELLGATVTGASVERDGKVITGKGMGVSVAFSLALLAVFSPEAAERIKAGIQCEG